MRVIGYYRPFPWSRIGCQRTGRTTVERTLRAFCREGGMHVVDCLLETDDRIGVGVEDRHIGRQVMTSLREGTAEGVVVARPEHIFSSASDALSSLERWLDEGIGFFCADFYENQPLVVHRGFRLAGADIFVRGLSDLQRRVDLEKTRRRVEARKARGSWTGRVPFGFRLCGGKLVEDPDRIPRIQEMKKAHRRGKSYREIARIHGVSIGTAHRLVRSDLRKLRRIGQSELGSSMEREISP